MRTAIATVCLSGTLPEKIDAIAAAQFKGIEIFENDLLSFNGTPRDARRHDRRRGPETVTFQPFRDFEGMPEPAARKGLRARRAQVRRHGGARLRSADGLQQCLAGLARRHRSRRRRLSRARRAGRAPRHARRLRGAVLGAAYPRLPRRLGGGAAGRPPGARPRARLLPRACARHRPRRHPGDSAGPHLPGADGRRAEAGDGLSSAGAGTTAAFPARATCRSPISCARCTQTGFDGLLSLEIFNDRFRAGSARSVAVDGQRSLIVMLDELRQQTGRKLPGRCRPCRQRRAAPASSSSNSRPTTRARVALEQTLGRARLPQGRAASLEGRDAMAAGRHQHRRQRRERGLRALVQHRARSVRLRAGAARRRRASARSSGRWRCSTSPFQQPVGPGEMNIPAVRGLGGSLLYFVDHAQRPRPAVGRRFRAGHRRRMPPRPDWRPSITFRSRCTMRRC